MSKIINYNERNSKRRSLKVKVSYTAYLNNLLIRNSIHR